MRYNIFFASLLLLAAPSFAEVRFAQLDHGINHQYTGDWEFFVGGGVSSFDCNGDGFAELFTAGGSSPSRLLANVTASRGGKIAFTDITPIELALTRVSGAYALDIDSDGKLDLVILRVGNNKMFRGLGNCRFSEFPQSLGFASADHWTTAFSATWEAGAELPTLAFGNYVDRQNPQGPFEACADNFLYRPISDHYTNPLRLTPGFCSLSVLFSDWGRRGRMDLRISNDRHYYVKGGSEQLWAMESVPRLYDTGDGWQDYSIWGMGIASRDITGDGLPEIFLTSMGDQKLQLLETAAGGPRYHNASFDRGITAHRPFTGGDGRPSTGWHAEFADFNNDGRDDIFIAKGNVEQMPSSAMRDPNNLLMQNADGRFVEFAEIAGVASPARGRGAATVDLNLDGLPDLVVVNRRAPLEIYQNTTRNALLVSLHQSGINSRAIGAWIEVQSGIRRWYREVTVGGGHAGGSASDHHFGLGSTDKLRLRVIWPDGKPSHWLELKPDQRIRLKRTTGDRQLVVY